MTPERFRRLRAVLDKRQPDLTVLMDNVHKPHNFSAIVRSCDAVGVFEAHAVWPAATFRPHRLTSGGAAKWVNLRTHETLQAAVDGLRDEGHQVVAAHPGQTAQSYLDLDYTRPTAFVMGAELSGLSEQALGLADHLVVIPMAGHVESLNVSVATALLLFEARRQRAAAGMYSSHRLEPDVYSKTLFEWSQPEVAAFCRRHGRPYPAQDEDGQIVGDSWRG